MVNGPFQLPEVDEKLAGWMREIRRDLHRRPELSFKEVRTAERICQELTRLGIPFSDGWAETGVVGLLTGSREGRHVGLRADMDALPVMEAKDVDYASTISGVMHACGHDGHVAMLLGAAALLGRIAFSGKVSLVFQPAEEFGNGAEKVVAQGLFKSGIEAMFAGHLDTHFPVGTITVDEGIICSYADAFRITLYGKGGHAARPHEARDSIVAAASLVVNLQTLVSRQTDPNHSAVVTVGRIQGGVAHNVIAERTVLEGTIRSASTQARERVLAGLAGMIMAVEPQYGVRAELIFTETLPAVINSPLASRLAARAARQVVAEHSVISQGRASLGGEDFAFYQQQCEGCLVRFGAELPGAGPAHSGTFDFDEAALAVGARWLAAVALQWLGQGEADAYS